MNDDTLEVYTSSSANILKRINSKIVLKEMKMNNEIYRILLKSHVDLGYTKIDYPAP